MEKEAELIEVLKELANHTYQIVEGLNEIKNEQKQTNQALDGIKTAIVRYGVSDR